MAKLNRKNLLLVNFVLIFAIILILSNYRSVSVANKIINDQIIQPISNNDQSKNDFERVVSKWCDARNVSLNYICLNRVNELDRTSNSFIKPVCSNEDKIVFHTFWQFGSDSSFYMRVLKLNVMSFLSTQNLDCSKLILWTLNSFSPSIKSNILSIFDYYVRSRVLEVRQFDLKELCREARDRKAHFAKSSVCLFSNKQDYSDIYNMVGFSDLIRFFVLDIYGGLYVDGDILFLKDMSILSNYNFAYRWSYTTNYNTAVMGINRKLADKSDKLYSIFINETTNSISSLISQLHPNELSRLVRNRLGGNSEIFSYDALQVFHSCFFDPAWLCFDGVVKNPDPTFVCSPIDFTNRKLIDSNKFQPDGFFPGAFTYHLHLSRRDFNFSSDSYFGYFESYFSKTLKLN